MYQYKKSIVIGICLLFVLASCATFQEKWNALGRNERARVIVAGVQTELESLFDAGKAYVTANPDKQEMWKKQVIPAFDTANKSIAAYIVFIGKGEATPEGAVNTLFPLLKSVVNLLASMGLDMQAIENIIGGAE